MFNSSQVEVKGHSLQKIVTLVYLPECYFLSMRKRLFGSPDLAPAGLCPLPLPPAPYFRTQRGKGLKITKRQEDLSGALGRKAIEYCHR